jgi:DNA-binding PadR family transcriptional regulator
MCNYVHMLGEVILTVLAHRPMTGYEIARSFDQSLSHFWHASHQQIYRELARLNRQGLVVYRSVAQSGRPDKKRYSLTSSGRATLRKWVVTETDLPRPRYDLLVKLMAGLLVNKPGLEKEITRVQNETAVFLEQLRAMDAICRSQPLLTGYDSGLYLALRRGLLLVEAQTVWLAEVKQFLSSGARKRVSAVKV